MSLKKAIMIVDKGKKGKETIQVLFNPNQYTINSGTDYKWHKITGLSSPVGQYVSGDEKTLTMDLFFDTSIEQTDVREYTNKITEIMDIESDLHVPPLCTFAWGKFTFTGVLQKVTQNFTMFLASGTPVRATLNVTIVEKVSIVEQDKKRSLQSADRTKRKVLNQNEQLWMIADKEYEDPRKWREIAKANNIDNPRILKTGTTITIPRLD